MTKIDKRFLSGNEAVAEGVRLCRPQVIAAYPITPQTTLVEKLSEFVADKEFPCEYMLVESEHSAMAATMGASMMGVRTFTATSSQGLLYMCEMLNFVSGSRFPVVMVDANRSTATPWNIFGDHRDAMAMRDSGWIQLYTESGQESMDTVIQAYRIAEDPRILTPIMVNLDGFSLTHTYDLVEVPDQEVVDRFLPAYQTDNKLDLKNPKSQCISIGPDFHTEIRLQQQDAMDMAKKVIADVDAQFGKEFGRSYGGLVQEYRCDDADYVLVVLGSVAGVSRTVVDELRKQGEKVGVIRVRSLRPFPNEYFASLKNRFKALGVLDRNLSFGNQGGVYTETKAALFTPGNMIQTLNFIAGLGGRDITKVNIAEMFSKLKAVSEGEAENEMQFIGLRWS